MIILIHVQNINVLNRVSSYINIINTCIILNRIRGLLPNCLYNIQLKDSSAPELLGLKLAKAPPTLEVRNISPLITIIKLKSLSAFWFNGPPG